MIPVLRPLKDPAVATVWSGLAASTIGEDLFRVAVVWIAAEQIGNAAGYVNAAQYGAMLVVGLLGASLFDRWRADRAMIGAQVRERRAGPAAGRAASTSGASRSRCW